MGAVVSGRIILAATVAALALTAAAGAAPRAGKPAPPAKAPNSEAAKLVQSCDAHKFETVVHEVVDGQPHQSRVKLCGKEGQSDADWLVTLRDAVAKVSGNAEMAKPVRDQIVAALNAEINRLEHPVNPLLPRRKSAEKSILDDLSPLPALRQGEQAQASPLPQASQAPAGPLPPPRQVARTAPREDYAALPPLPTAPPAPVHVLAGGISGTVPMLPKPRMSLTCYTPGETNDGPCTGFTRQTLVTVRAQEDLPAGTSLRFVRDGDPKADVELAQLKKGKAMQFAVPGDVCRHVVGGRLELRIVRSGQEVDSDGPFNLNC
jgi:hypothetical protein